MGRKVNWGIIAAGGIARRRTLPAMKDVPNAVITGCLLYTSGEKWCYDFIYFT